MASDRRLWERQENETDRAWAAFQVYRDLLPGDRSYDAAYRKTYDKPTNIHAPKWYRDWAKEYDWIDRARAWDRHLDDIERAAAEEERREWRKKRRSMLMGFGSKLSDVLNVFDPQDVKPSLSQITQAVDMLIQQMRAEMDDLPTEKRDVTTGGQPIAITTVEVVKDYGDESVPDS